MSYTALYRKFRPQTFSTVIGQEHIVRTLKNQMRTGRVSHAYLFCGTRGTGKTSTAKIFARAINCTDLQEDGEPCNHCAVCRDILQGRSMNVIEIDAASNNSVDNIREIREEVKYPPTEGHFKVYIIDEVHMLSLSAFNALLKIIEEPPEHLLFILATTELHKVPATILSRCQRFSFRRITPEDIASRLSYVAYQEGIDLDESAARVLARLADGGMRDGLSLLDQCASATVGELNDKRVYECLGIAGEQTCGKMLGYAADRNTKAALELFNRLYADGKDVGAMLDELASLCRDLMILKTAPDSGISMLSGVASDEETKALVQRFSPGELVRMIGLLQQTAAGFTRSASRRLDAELCIMNLCEPGLQTDMESVNARLSRVEEQLKNGDFTVKQIVQTAVPSPEPESAAEELPAEPEDNGPATEADVPNEAPMGFWPDLVEELHKEMRPPLKGFFMPTAKSPVQGSVRGNQLVLLCANGFTLEMINKPEVLALVQRKASTLLGRAVTVKAVDRASKPAKSKAFEELMAFGREHGDILSVRHSEDVF